MDKKEFRCEINGKTYILRPLVLGQVDQMTKFLEGIEITSNMDTMDVMRLLGDRLSEAVAIVLTEEGKKLKDKDIHALAEEIQESMDIGTAMEIIDHFFALNPIASVIEKLAGTMKAVHRLMTGSKEASSSSPEQTLHDTTGSSGDILRETASHISKSGRAGGSSGKQ